MSLSFESLKGLRNPISWILNIGLMPLASNAIGQHFLLDPAWPKKVAPLAWGFGIFISWLTLKPLRLNLAKQYPPTEKHATYRLMLILCVLTVFLSSAELVRGGIPFYWTTMAGQQVERQFIVEKFSSTKYCRHGISLRDLPVLYGKLCGVPDKFRSTLKRGDTVIVTGRGTDLGIFPSTARLAP